MDGFVEDELPGCDQEEGLPPEQPQELPARDDDVAQAAQPAIAAPLARVQAPPDLEAVMASFHLVDRRVGTAHFTLCDIAPPHGVRGIIQELHAGTPSLKGLCKNPTHRQCICWVSNTSHRRPEVMSALVTWIAQGRTISQADHMSAAKELKRFLGMRIR